MFSLVTCSRAKGLFPSFPFHSPKWRGTKPNWKGGRVESSCSTSWDRTFMNGLLTPNLGYLISPVSKKRRSC